MKKWRGRERWLWLVLLLGSISTHAQQGQGYNFNVGGLSFQSGGSVPSSCPIDGTFFWLNSGTKAWYVCANGTYAAMGTSATVSLTVPANSIFSVSGSPGLNLVIGTSGTPGGIPWFSSSSQLNSSALLSQYGIMFGGGVNSPPSTSSTFTTNANGSLLLNMGVLTSDISPLFVQWSTNASGIAFTGVKFVSTNVAQASGTFNYQFCGGSSGQNCVTVDPSGNVATPGTLTTGIGSTAAGSVYFQQGTDQSFPATSTNGWMIEAPTSVTGNYKFILPTAPATGLVRGSNASGKVTLSFGAVGTDISGPLACADTSGSGTAQVCNTSPTFTPISGSQIIYTTTTANTGALTINVNSLGAKPGVKYQTTALVANDICANTQIVMTYDGTNWEASTICNVPAGTTPTVSMMWSPAVGQTSGLTGVTQNNTRVWAYYIPTQITTTAVCYTIATADNTANVYDIGLYNSGGTLVVHTGATAGTTLFSATGVKCVNWASGGATLSPGLYAFAYTSSAAAPAAVLGGATTSGYMAAFATANPTGGTTSGGALNSSITFPTTAWGANQIPNAILH